MDNDNPRPGGPRFALTDFLRSHNISTNASSRARRGHPTNSATSTMATPSAQTVGEGQEKDGEDEKDATDGEDAIDGEDVTDGEDAKDAKDGKAVKDGKAAKGGKAAKDAKKDGANDVRKRKREREEAREMHKIRISKRFKKECASHPNEDEEAVLRRLHFAQVQKQRRRNQTSAASMPGQTANCESCQQRFTVTPYTRAGPNGGLLCTKCGKNLADEEDAKKSKKASNGVPGKGHKEHRKKQAGTPFGTGVKSLVTLCIETLAANISLADSFGDLPPLVIDRIARMLSKRRMINSQTLELFLPYQPEDMCIYDAAQLEQQDYIRIFQVCTGMKQLKLYNAIQFRDEAVEYLIGRNFNLESLYLSGANLLTEKGWTDYLKAKGGHLKSLRVYFTDQEFNRNVLAAIKHFCLSLERLKICHNQQVSDDELECIASIQTLRHIGLHLVKETTTRIYISIINHLGKNLETFSIRTVPQVGDGLLEAIHANCTRLSKLRITHSEAMTDAGFVKLFTGWKNKPLKFIDFEKCLPIANANPQENTKMVGLHSNGFQAMMNHSGLGLKKLNIHCCRYISGEAFEEVFALGKIYPDLLDLEVSFCESVTDYIVGLIFKSCPRLQKLNVFGCMKVSDPRVPRGKFLVGLQNAKGISIQGTED
ncbi:RNI-like protein [Annulohypoxylon maeteangense]|uniref:RNI-like protein n=1 Tax=Annulohypoxylon maeteangense TaxID=1927788 RepID=UPI0020088F85|nr:RNI-like protein [Annulohypoxylon maeteangense]KAI0883194.1 RNI-like protein [Annulohypoxylon maeteangense]